MFQFRIPDGLSHGIKKNIPTHGRDGINGVLSYRFFLVRYWLFGEEPKRTGLCILTATTLVATIQAFVTGAATHHDVATYIACGSIALHTFGCSIHGIHT